MISIVQGTRQHMRCAVVDLMLDHGVRACSCVSSVLVCGHRVLLVFFYQRTNLCQMYVSQGQKVLRILGSPFLEQSRSLLYR